MEKTGRVCGSLAFWDEMLNKICRLDRNDTQITLPPSPVRVCLALSFFSPCVSLHLHRTCFAVRCKSGVFTLCVCSGSHRWLWTKQLHWGKTLLSLLYSISQDGILHFLCRTALLCDTGLDTLYFCVLELGLVWQKQKYNSCFFNGCLSKYNCEI